MSTQDQSLRAQGGVRVKPLFDLLVDAYVRGIAWQQENPGGEVGYAGKAAYDYADKITSSLEAPPAPVSEEIEAAYRAGHADGRTGGSCVTVDDEWAEYRAALEASPAPVGDLSGQDLQLLDRLKRDNVWDGARPVLEGPRTDPETEQAFRLSDQGYIALEQVARGVRLHITRKGVTALTAALAAKGGQ